MSGPDLAACMRFLKREEVMPMFRVSYLDSSEGQRWCLCGRLVGPWVDDLRSCWRQAREQSPGARVVVDLRDVTFIDEAGERLLAEMEVSGAELIAAGVENKDLIATLKDRSHRPLRRRLQDLCECSGERAMPQGEEKGK